MPSFECKDLGMYCNYIAKAKTEEKLMNKIAKHAKKKHGLDSIPEEMLEKVKKVIKAS